ATCAPAGLTPRLVEVYPHPALLVLMAVDYRVPYKVSRARRYWPALTAPERRRRLVRMWREIHAVLARTISGCDIPIPTEEAAVGLPGVALKRHEAALDPRTCPWVAIQSPAGRCDCYGDDTAAIWAPVAASA